MNISTADFPNAFLQRIQNQFPEEWAQLLDSLNEPAPISIRLHPGFIPLIAELKLEPVPWEENAFYLNRDVQFGTDPLFQAGAYYVQEASSMAVGWMIRKIIPEFPYSDLLVLDACAAPGGKSTQILSLLPQEAVLVANEIVPGRYSILSENLTKWGSLNQIRLQKSISGMQVIQECFDIIVADAPCSGEGMFRKNTEARREWQEDSEKICALRQIDILTDLLPLLKPGGFILYSTCTFAPSENEGIMQWLQEKGLTCFSTQEAPALGWKKVVLNSETWGWQAIPPKVKGEGFFFTVFQKQGIPESTDLEAPAKQGKISKHKKNIPTPFNTPEGVVFQEGLDGSLFIQSRRSQELQAELNRVGIRSRAGLQAGVWKGDKFIPDAELAFWKNMPQDVYPMVELNREDAGRFLSKENLLSIPEGKGFHRVNFRGMGLGWINLMPGRMNNLYPAHWRLRDKSNPALDPLPEQE
jgi:16S rRNA C967 or C1407 C5-methylase (RsmB/RsmF family)